MVFSNILIILTYIFIFEESALANENNFFWNSVNLSEFELIITDTIPIKDSGLNPKNDSIKISISGAGNLVKINSEEILKDTLIISSKEMVEGEVSQEGNNNKVQIESFSGKSDKGSNTVTVTQKGNGNKVKINNH